MVKELKMRLVTDPKLPVLMKHVEDMKADGWNKVGTLGKGKIGDESVYCLSVGKDVSKAKADSGSRFATFVYLGFALLMILALFVVIIASVIN